MLRMMKRIFPLLLAFAVVACKSSLPDEKIVGEIFDSAAVVSAHPLASKVGAEILRSGGNAVDAAIATQFALAVVFPAAGNIGGGGFMILRRNNGDVATLDYREMAAGTATANMYLDPAGAPVPGFSEKRHLSVGVPGPVA